MHRGEGPLPCSLYHISETNCSPSLRTMSYWSCCEMLTLAILLLCSAPQVHGQAVKAIEGQAVTLPCFYRITQSSDITDMCWGRGACPNSKCNGVLIWTDGHKVTYRSSGRYQLNGQMPRGDVSLTIGQASLSDGGTYCCRIEHRGWFNDEKFNIQLNVEKAPKTTRPPTTTTTTTPVVTTTLLPTTPARITTPPPTPTPEETTLPPTTALQSTPAGTTPAPPAVTTASPLSTTKSTTPEPQPEGTTTPPTTMPTGGTTTPVQQPPGTDSNAIDNSAHENTPEATVHQNPRTTLSSEPESYSDKNGMADFISANTTVVEKETGLPLHILITAICLFLIAVAVAAVFYLKLRWQKKGRYPVGFDPNLELVAHAEEPLPEPEAEISQTVTLEADNAEANKPKMSEQQICNKTEE